MNITLRVIGLLGIVLFGAFLYFTYSTPGYVEEVGKDFIKFQIKKKTVERIDQIKLDNKDTMLGKLAGSIYKKNQEKIEILKIQLKEKVHEKLADVIAEMRDLDCECRNKYAAIIKQQYQLHIVSLQTANEKLKDFMRAKYMEVAMELKHDVRIFTGSNALIFLLLLLVSFLKPGAVAHLFLPAILLVISTLTCSYFYVFEQNWLFTIIYNDYLGYGYLGYVGVLFLFLCDIVFNHARVTTQIINGILEAIGSAASVVPC
jgi:hypothetical protein